MPPWGGLFNSKKDNASDGSVSPTPNTSSKRDKRKEKAQSSSSSHGMAHLRDYTSGDDPRMHAYRLGLRGGVDPRSNGHFIDMHEMGYGSRGDPEFIRSRLMNQFQSSLNTAVTDSIRKACIHWDDEVLNLENNYHTVLEERNGLRIENKSLANRVKALEQEVNAKVALLREFQSGYLKTSGSRKLPPSSSAISAEFEELERRIKSTVFSRLARLDINDPYIQTLLQHGPFLEAVKGIMVDENQAKEADNLPLNLLEVIEEPERKGLLIWMIQGVIHDVLHKKIMKIHMPGLDNDELKVMNKIYNIIALSEEGQGIRSAQEWRADTYRRLAYWAENVDELTKHIEVSPAISEISQIFASLIDGTEKEITRILEPFCDDTQEGKNFSSFIVDIVDRAFQFSILIGSQNSRYELHRDVDNTDDFKAVPEHLDDKPGPDNISNASLFYAVPALVKTSGEDGEAYEVSELLVQGKIYVLFGLGDAIDEEEAPDVRENPPITLASPVNGGEIGNEDIDAITKAEASPETQSSDKTKIEPKEGATGPSTKPSGTDRNIDLQRNERVERPNAEERIQRRHRHDDLQEQRDKYTQGDARNSEPVESGSRRAQARHIHEDEPSDTRPRDPRAPTSSYPEDPKRTLGVLAQQRAPIVRKGLPESRSPPDRDSSLPKSSKPPIDPRTGRPTPTGSHGSHPRTSMPSSSSSGNRNRPTSTNPGPDASGIAYGVANNQSAGDPPTSTTSRNSAGKFTRTFDVVNTSQTRAHFAERARAQVEQQQRDFNSAVHAAHLASRTSQLEQQLRQQQEPNSGYDSRGKGPRY